MYSFKFQYVRLSGILSLALLCQATGSSGNKQGPRGKLGQFWQRDVESHVSLKCYLCVTSDAEYYLTMQALGNSVKVVT